MRDKFLLHVDGLPQLRRIALQAMATSCAVLVTVPTDNPLRAAALQGLAVTIVAVPDSVTGISASSRAGYRAAGDSATLMMLPDLPELETVDLSTLIAAYEVEPAAIHRGSAGSRPGHPVVMPKDLLPKLADLSGDQIARGLMTRRHTGLSCVICPARTLCLIWTRGKIGSLGKTPQHAIRGAR